jgi:hypothetical protein
MARSNRPVILAAVGAVVIVGGIVAFILVGLTSGSEPVSAPSTPSSAPRFDPSEYSEDELESVYPQVLDLGLVPEPITKDPEEYVTAAVAAWGTYDTTTSTTIPQWKKYLESWQNVYPLVVDPVGGADQVHSAGVEPGHPSFPERPSGRVRHRREHPWAAGRLGRHRLGHDPRAGGSCHDRGDQDQ